MNDSVSAQVVTAMEEARPSPAKHTNGAKKGNIRYVLGSWALIQGVPAEVVERLVSYIGYQFKLGGKRGWRWTHQSRTFAAIEENGDVLIPSGLVSRVVGYLSKNGWGVEVDDQREDRRPLRTEAEVLMHAPTEVAHFLKNIDDHRMGQIPVRSEADIVQYIIGAVGYFSDARILLVTGTRSAAYRLLQRFFQNDFPKAEVRDASTATEYQRVVIAPASSGLAGDIARYDFVFYVDCGVLAGERALKVALRDNSVRVFGFAIPKTSLSSRAALAVEGICGPLLYEADKYPNASTVPPIFHKCPLPGAYEQRKRRRADRDGRISADAHEGTPDDFLRRHGREARQAAQDSKKRRRDFASSRLLKRVADSRNMYIAIRSLRNNSQKTSPGPDGLRLEELTYAECWNLARTLASTIREGTYRPGHVTRIHIPKNSGQGTRTLEIASEADRVVERAILQILQPLVDPNFDSYSFGFRPGLGREHALVALESLTEPGGIWITEDLKDAFEHVPHARLLDVLRSHGLDSALIGLIERIIRRNGRRRGIPQGSPLSPLLLNLYCDHFIDKPWRRRNPGTPLLRYADDLMIISPNATQAVADRELMQQLTRAAGLPLKKELQVIETEPRSIHQEQWTEWLGFRIRPVSRKRIETRLGLKALDTLQAHLEEQIPVPPGYSSIIQIVRGWVDQQGPCFPCEEDILSGYSKIVSVIGKVVPDEVTPTLLEKLQGWWEKAFCRFEELRRVLLLEEKQRQAGGGSAGRHFDSAKIGRSGGVPDSGTPPLSTPNVLLYVSGGCLRNPGPGGWAYILENSAEYGRFSRAESRSRLTGARAELMAVIRGLERLDFASRVTVVTASEYVVRGIEEWLPRWRRNDWRFRNGKKPKNRALWYRLDALLKFHEVELVWVDLRNNASPGPEGSTPLPTVPTTTVPQMAMPADMG